MGGKGHVATVGNHRQTIVGESPATHLKTIWPKGSTVTHQLSLSFLITSKVGQLPGSTQMFERNPLLEAATQGMIPAK
jgi:hypothetical protein